MATHGCRRCARTAIAPRLWEVVPGIYGDMRQAGNVLSRHQFACRCFYSLVPIGGDRDGHPHVTFDITQTLLWLRQAAIQAHTIVASSCSSSCRFRITKPPWPILKQNCTRHPPNGSACGRARTDRPGGNASAWLAMIEWRLRQSSEARIGESLPPRLPDGTAGGRRSTLIDSLHGNRGERLITKNCFPGSILSVSLACI